MAKIKAEYIDHMGSDLRVADAARVSMAKQSAWEAVCWSCDYASPDTEWDDHCPKCGEDNNGRRLGRGLRLAEKDAKLIRFLARHNHWTPFGHCIVTIRASVPIFIARQAMKSQVGFVANEVSRRYVDDPPEFFEPTEWRARAPSVKQGSSDEIVEGFNDANDVWTTPEDCLNAVHECARRNYEDLLAMGVCPEQARMVLPQSMMTSYYWTGSLAAWARFVNLRLDPHAQKEIQVFAEQISKIIEPLFPVSWAALVRSPA